DASNINFDSKYGTQLVYSKKADLKPMKSPYVHTQKDTIIGDIRHLQVLISSQRPVNTFEFYAGPSSKFLSFNINGLDIKKKTGDNYVFQDRIKNRLFSYMVTEDNSLALTFTVPATQPTT